MSIICWSWFSRYTRTGWRKHLKGADVPVVSVVIPVYNVEKWLPACLDSVLTQTLEDIEVICVNDCSPDGCADILAGYAARDPRVRVIALDRNSGQGVARNVGFEASSGRYVYFLDSDDMVVPHALEELARRADDDQLDGVFFDSTVLYDSPDLAKRYSSESLYYQGNYSTSVQSGTFFFEQSMNQREYSCLLARQFWRREFLDANDLMLPEWISHEDEAFTFEAMALAKRTALVRKPFYIRRLREGSVTTGGYEIESMVGSFCSYCRIIRFMHEHGIASIAADRNAARLYCLFLSLYERFSHDGIDIDALFAKKECHREFLFFRKEQIAYGYYGYVSPRALSKARAAEKVYLFGAGRIAADITDYFAERGIAIEGYLVTRADENPAVLRGHYVCALQDFPCDPHALVVIAVADRYRAGIEESLESAGWNYVYCRSGGEDVRG